ncbi:MAG: hypothetical protein K2I38_00470 [Duncaniella sp.]|nr:hypothetical protein [Duncaniella sp.]
MLYSLSTQVIADTVHALVALELLSASQPARSTLSPRLDPARRGVLTLMIKNAFAETVLDLLPYVDDADLDGEKPAASPGEHPADDSADHLMKIALRVPAAPGGERPAGIHGLIRRQLEMTVVSRVIHTALLAAGGSLACDIAGAYASKLATALDSLTALLRAPATPFVRQRFW